MNSNNEWKELSTALIDSVTMSNFRKGYLTIRITGEINIWFSSSSSSEYQSGTARWVFRYYDTSGNSFDKLIMETVPIGGWSTTDSSDSGAHTRNEKTIEMSTDNIDNGRLCLDFNGTSNELYCRFRAYRSIWFKNLR